jgi:hypothetical protein
VGPLSTIEGISPFEQPSPNDRLSLFSNTAITLAGRRKINDAAVIQIDSR